MQCSSTNSASLPPSNDDVPAGISSSFVLVVRRIRDSQLKQEGREEYHRRNEDNLLLMRVIDRDRFLCMYLVGQFMAVIFFDWLE